MKKIFKYNLAILDTQTILMPIDSKILCVKNQYGSLVLYAEVSTNNKQKEVTIIIVGTGHEIPNLNLKYIDTVMTNNDTLVWHVYKEVV